MVELPEEPPAVVYVYFDVMYEALTCSEMKDNNGLLIPMFAVEFGVSKPWNLHSFMCYRYT